MTDTAGPVQVTQAIEAIPSEIWDEVDRIAGPNGRTHREWAQAVDRLRCALAEQLVLARSSSTASSAATLNVPTAVMAEGERKEAVRAAAALLAPYSADPAGTPTRDALVFLNAAINEAAAAHFAALAASSHPASAGDETREALAFIDKFFEPWGSWKTVWWESEVSGDAAFSADNALKHVANILRRALSATPAQEVDETERLRSEMQRALTILERNLHRQNEKCDDAVRILRRALAHEGDAR